MADNTIASKVKSVNEILLAGEPGNISVDEHSGYIGYKPQAVVDAMNAVFVYGEWWFEEIINEIEVGDKSSLAVAKVKVFLKGIEFQPSGWGQSRVTRGDIGDARKGAQTDAIKKALSYFSIGNRAYLGLLKDGKKENNASGNSSASRSSQPAQQKQATKIQTEVKDRALVPTVQPQPPSKDVLMSRQNSLCSLAIEKSEVVKGTPQETGDSFFKFCSKVLGVNVTARGHLTASRLDTIEKYLNDKPVVAKAS